MQTNTTAWTNALILAAAGVAHAQPFAHHIAEPFIAREVANDLIVQADNDLAAVGAITSDTADITAEGYIVITDPASEPLRSWITQDPGSNRDSLLAAREDSADRRLIVLQEGVQSINPAVEDLVLFKIDTGTGVIGYQWRYPGSSSRRNLGMELDRETGLVASSAINTFGGAHPTLLRFNNATGLPVFHNRYIPAADPLTDMRFFDVAVDPDSGAIFAVGRLQSATPGGPSQGTLLIARFTPAGAPVWFASYPLAVGTSGGIDPAEGAGIELTRTGDVAVSVRVTDPQFGPVTAHVVVNAAGGLVLAAGAVANTQSSIQPAFSSLERLPSGVMLVTGAATGNAGAPLPGAWTFDETTADLVWAWTPDAQTGTANASAIQSQSGLLLAGGVTPNAGPIGGMPDVFLARTTPAGEGLCPTTPDLREVDIAVTRAPVQVTVVPMPQPLAAALDARSGEPVFRTVCDRCPADLAPPFGVLNFFDMVEFINLYNAMDPAADLAPPSGVFNFFDLQAYLALLNAGCP